MVNFSNPMENQAKQIKLLANMNWIPYKISTGNGFFGFTADQWKSFILIYAIPLMWGLLVTSDQNILANFIKTYSLLTCRIINIDMLSQAHDRLLQVALLIEENYGQEFITQTFICPFTLPIAVKIMAHCIHFGAIHSKEWINKLILLFLCCSNLPYRPKNISYCFL